MDWRPALLLCFIGAVVATKPTLMPSDELVEKSQNKSYVVFCSINGTNKVEWHGPRGKLPVGNAGSSRVHVEDKGRLGLALIFDRIDVSDKGQYTCTANNEKASLTLVVIKIPQFKNCPTEQHVREFQSRVIKCEVDGEPKPVINWQRNGVTLENTSDRKYVVDGAGLKVINATKSDAGVFTFRAIQTGLQDAFIYTQDITVKVQHKPEWKESGEEVQAYGYLTGETNLTCDAVAEPEANYTWTKINPTHKHLPLNTTEIKEPGRSVLKIYVHNDSYGDYKCEAHNNLGRISKIFHLGPGKKPDPPTGLRVVSTTVHNATLKIASETEDLVGYRVQFVIVRPGVEVSWDSPDFQDLPKTDNGHHVIIDLLENTSYEVRVATRSSAGLSDFADNTQTLRTLKYGDTSSAWMVACQPLFLLVTIVVMSSVH